MIRIVWIVIFGIVALNLLLNANMHGKDKTGKHNFWVGLLANTINVVLFLWLAGWRIE